LAEKDRMNKRSKRILITGGAGFIGSHLAERFLSQGHSVVAIDNFITGSEANVRHLTKQKNFKLMRHNISKPVSISGPVDVMLHFASPASPPDYLKHPIETLLVGSQGTQNALDIARIKKAVFVMASTSEVYGDPLVSPQPESYWGNVNSAGPRSVYDEAKRFSEAITMAYHRFHRVNTKIIRIFNTYGPRMRPEDGRVIPNFATQALLGKPITVYGDGTQTRSYCYVNDLLDGIEKMMLSNLHEPVNLGNPNEMTVLDLAHVMIRMTGSKSKIIYKDLPVDDPKVRCPDISLAKRLLDWSPVVDREEGLMNTIDYIRKILFKNK
jgi:dTDP-glucose 4,6-dehydratase